MFGRQDDTQDTQNQQLDDQQAAYVTDLTASDLLPEPPPALPVVTPSSSTMSSTFPAAQPASIPPLGGAPAPNFDVSSVLAGTPPVPGSGIPVAAPQLENQDQLLDIKHQALTELSPLVNHLEQSPEEKFKITMMLIQASDDPALIQQAYESAKQLTDDKARAQALLDIVNEINYFTQPKH